MDELMDTSFKAATLRINDDILALIAEIDEFKGAWQAIGRIAPERLSSLRRVATIESIGSSTRIEGARLSDRQVEALLRSVEIKAFETRDEQEVAGYAEAMDVMFENAREIQFTQNHIKQLHRDLLRHSDKDERHRGEYKTHSNNVEAFGPDGETPGVIFETATPFDTPRRMDELVIWTASELETGKRHRLLTIAIFVVVFLAIHPFQDGNGKLSRILTTLLLLRAGYDYVPYSSLENIIEQSKEGYYLALRQTQGEIRSDSPDWLPWVMYFLDALKQQKDRLAKKIERERLLLGDLPELSQQILEMAREHGRLTVADAVKLTGANRNTIKNHLKTLTEKGFLERHGAGRGTWYRLA